MKRRADPLAGRCRLAAAPGRPRCASWLAALCLGLLALVSLSVSAATAQTEPPRQVLRVVVADNYPPFLFIDPNGEPAGYLVDYWALWTRKTGVPVDLLPMRWEEAQRRLLNGEADVIDLIFRTPQREASYAFSAAYATVPVSIYSHVSITGVRDVRSLRGFQIGVMAGDACIDMLHLEGVDGLVTYESYAALIEGALAEDVKLLCIDDYPANYYLYRQGVQKLFRRAFELYEGQFHRAVRKGDAETLALIERGATLISADEDAELRARWVPAQAFDYEAYIQPLGWIAGGLVLTVLTLLVWLRSVRRAVALRTAELAAYREGLEVQVSERTAALAAANEEQQALFDAMMSGVVFVRDRMIVRCNPALERIFGYAPGELIGKRTRIWYPDEASFLSAGKRILAAQRSGGHFVEDLEMVRKDGSRFWVRTRARTIDPDDPGKGIVGVLDDITEERAAAEAVLHAKVMAEEAARVKSDFLANMSHEIRTPLNVILGMTHLALSTALDARQREFLEKIRGASQHLLAIINDILDLSKIESGKMVLEEMEFEPRTLLEGAVALFAEQAIEKGLWLTHNVAPDVPQSLKGDRLRIEQVLVNYLSNAVKFTESGGIAVQLGVASHADDEWVLHFSVRDTGIGLSESTRRRLFKPFEQADTSTTRKYGGTGLGLAIARRLAEMMGGEAGVDSVPGQGASFWFTARLRSAGGSALDTQAAGVDTIADAQARIRGEHDLARFSGARILLVEDNALNQLVAVELIKHVGLLVDVAENGQVALDMLARTPYALVLMDMQMPVMDGVAATREIRRDPRHARLPIIAMTANAMDVDKMRCLEAGMNDHLGKPIEPQRLWATLAHWLEWARSHAADPTQVAPSQVRGGESTPAGTGVPGAGAGPCQVQHVKRVAGLTPIAGLDIEAGLCRALGRAELYRSMLGRFVEGQGNTAAALDAALREGEHALAERLVHTLKGASAQIGAEELAAAAESLERALRAESARAEVDLRYATLVTLLEEMLAGIGAQLSPQRGRAAGETVGVPPAEQGAREDVLAAEALLERLADMLAADDFGVGRVLEEHAPMLRVRFGDGFEAFARAVRHFDHAEALTQLKAVMRAPSRGT